MVFAIPRQVRNYTQLNIKKNRTTLVIRFSNFSAGIGLSSQAVARQVFSLK